MWKLLILAVLTILASAYKDYTGYKVLRFLPQNDKDITFIKSLEERMGEPIDFWQELRSQGKPVDIMLSPNQLIKGQSLFKTAGIEPSVMIENVQELIDLQKTRDASSTGRDITSEYLSLEEIESWIVDFVNNNKDKTLSVSLEDVSDGAGSGYTYEGRIMQALKFSTEGSAPKPVAFFYGGLHSREWITPAVMMNFAEMFVRDYGVVPEVTEALNAMDFYMIPVVNKDGYVYSWSNDRMWRKTRRIFQGAVCDGVDPNRNWDANFGGPGSSGLKCSDAYHGPYAFSEYETQNLRDFIKKLGSRVKLFMDVHAYSQLWMFPYGYTKKPILSADYDDLMASAEKAAARIAEVHGTTYKYGPIATTIYEASGSSVDWTYDTQGIKYSFALELRDEGNYGFLLPPSQILQTAEETYQGFLSVVEDVMKEYAL